MNQIRERKSVGDPTLHRGGGMLVWGLSKELRNKFKIACLMKGGKSMTETLREFIVEFVESAGLDDLKPAGEQSLSTAESEGNNTACAGS